MKKRTLSLLLAALLLGAPLAACGSPDEPAPSGETDPVTETLPPETESDPEPERSFADFPSRNFGGAELRLGDTEQYDIYLFSYREEPKGEVLNDALYDAHRNVEEKLNVTIELELFSDPDQLSRAVMAGDDSCGIMTGRDLNMGTLALNGYLLDISRLEPIDFTAPWWPESAVSSYLINGSMLLFSNYMSYYGISRARAWFINKQLCADLGMTVPYEEIFAGTWTLDKLNAMMKAAYADTNGNGETDVGDTLAFVNDGIFLCMQPSMGIDTFVTGGDGKLAFAFDVERASLAVDKLYSMLFETAGVFQDVKEERLDRTVFASGRSLFFYESLGMTETVLRDSNVEYGILCTPKLDETQPDYIAGYTDYLHAVPKTVTDTALVGWGIEALAASGYYTIFPAFRDVCLTNRYTYDRESAKVISLIGEKMYVELAYTFSAKLANIFRKLLIDGSTDVASYYASHADEDLKLMEQINAKYGKN